MNHYKTAIQIFSFLLAFLILQSAAYSQKAAAEFIASMAPPSVKEDISVKDGERYVLYHNDHLFAVNFWIGIQIWNVSNINSPQNVAFLRTEDMIYHILIEDNKLYAANKNAGVVVFDISNLSSPFEIGRIKTPGDAYWIDLEYPYMYVAMGNDGFCVMDITDLNDPRTLSLEIPENWIWSIDYHEEKIYVGAKQGGLLIYNASNLSNLVKITQFKTGFHALQFQIEDSLLYLADGPGGLLILDISSSRLPKEVGRYKTTGFSHHVFKSGNYAYLSNRELGLLIVKVADPANPELEAQYITDSETYASYKEDVYVFLATDNRTEILRHNNQPILEPLADMSIDEDSSFVLQLKANDPDGDAITFEVTNLPEGSTFDTETGLFTWKPTFEQSGEYADLTFSVIEKTATRLSDSETITLTVNHVNRIPELPAIASVELPEDSLLTIQVQEGSDPDKEDIGKLTYRVENIPEGVLFDSTSRTFTWKPTFDQSGVFIVDFILEDGAGGADREAVTITVIHVDRPPEINAVDDQTVEEAGNLAVQLSGRELDQEDLDKISFKILNLPEGASFDPTTKQFSWTPTFDQSGTYDNITTVMQAGALTDTAYFSITVSHVNRPPVLVEVPTQATDENVLLVFNIAGSDPDVEDKGKLIFTVTNLPPGAVFNPDSLQISWTPGFEQSGTFSDITFTVSDPQGLSDQKSTSITIAHVNRPPTLSEIPPLAIDENSVLTHQLEGNDPDVEDAGKLTYAGSGIPEGAILNETTGNFSWTPSYDQSGTYQVTFIVNDGALTDSKQAEITVKHVNRSPVMDEIGDQKIDENQPLNFTISANDPDQEDTGKLQYTANNLPPGADYNPGTQAFSWTPTYEQAGIYSQLTFTVTDSAGLSDEKSITITVSHVNRPPTLEPVEAIAVDEQQPVTFTLAGKDEDKEDTGKLQYQIVDLTEGATLEMGSGQFNWTPSYDQSGTYSFTAQVTDSAGLSAETQISITINNVNRPPVTESMETVSGNENEALTVTLKFSDPDQEDQGKLQVSATGLPEGATLDPASGVVTWTPTFEQSGQYSIEYLITDSFSATANGNVAIEITNVNRVPTAPVVSDIESPENEAVATVLAEGTDPDTEDQGKLSYSTENLPAGASFEASNRSLNWTPTFEQAGNYSITYTVSDVEGLSAQTTFSINIVNVNRPPTLPEIGNLEANEGETFNATLAAADDPDSEDKANLQYELQNLPAGASFNSASRSISWTPRYDQAGSYNMTYIVKDVSGELAQTSFSLTVNNVNQQPKFSSVGDKSVKVGEEISFTVNAEDADVEDQDKLNYSASNLPAGANFSGGSRTFTWIPRENQQGNFNVTFTVKDSQGGSAQLSIKITVEEIPPPAPPPPEN